MWIWRPILAGKCTIEGVKSGLVSAEDLFTINALLDMQDAMQAYAQEKTRPK